MRDVYVPMKLSVVSPEKAMELIPNIARYANKQNKVSDADSVSYTHLDVYKRQPLPLYARKGTHICVRSSGG